MIALHERQHSGFALGRGLAGEDQPLLDQIGRFLAGEPRQNVLVASLDERAAQLKEKDLSAAERAAFRERAAHMLEGGPVAVRSSAAARMRVVARAAGAGRSLTLPSRAATLLPPQIASFDAEALRRG